MKARLRALTSPRRVRVARTLRLNQRYGRGRRSAHCVCAWQWVDATRKNYYAKYSARMTLALHFFINLSILPSVANDLTVDVTADDDAASIYVKDVKSATVSDRTKSRASLPHLALVRLPYPKQPLPDLTLAVPRWLQHI
jgi:hypothetical protein